MKLRILSAICLLPFAAFAGGFQIPQQSIKATGLGGAYMGICSDAAAVFYNPGGMCNTLGQNFTVAGLGLFPYVSVLTPDNVNTDQTSKVFTPIEFYYSGQVSKKLWVGLSINNQFGSSASYPEQCEGMYIVQTIKLETFMFQPTIAYKICDKLSIGAGFVYTLGSFAATKAIPVSSQNSNNGEVSIDGTGHSFGFNVGAFSKIWEHKASDSTKMAENIQLGVSYRSGQPFNVSNGTANFTDIPASLESQFPSSENFSTQVNLPAVFSAGIAINLMKGNWHFTIAYDFNYTMWSTYDSLHFSFDDPNTPSSGYIYNWKNAMANRMGIEATYKQKYTLRVGYYIDGSPIQDGYVSPEVVDATNSGFSIGASYQCCKNLSVDFAYLRSDFTRNNATWQQQGSVYDFQASYHRIVNVFGIGVNYHLNCKMCHNSAN
jgi:long-chain fatty acid transport protein